MSLHDLTQQGEPLKLFAQRKTYSTTQLLENNLYCRLLSTLPDFSSWAEDVLCELLPVSKGNELQITLSNELHKDQTQTLVFRQANISIGRAVTSDIALPMQSISRQHARIFEQEDAFYIEDLHSVSGTYVNGQKLSSARPCRLNAGDEIRMYPYVLRAAPKAQWERDGTLRIATQPSPIYLRADEFLDNVGGDTCRFKASLDSAGSNILIVLSRSLLRAMLSRLTRSSKEVAIVEADATLLEFVAVCILERINKTLQYPFAFSLAPVSKHSEISGAGLMLQYTVGLSEGQGHIYLFLPGDVLEKISPKQNSLPEFTRSLLSWQLLLRVGGVSLGTAELENVEIGDILIYAQEYRLLLPADRQSVAPYKGWGVTRSEENPLQFVVQNVHEWGIDMTQEDTQETKKEEVETIDLATLPVHIHVVLARVDMSLQELETLSEGCIVQLGEETGATVQLVAGNTVIGSGELVNVDDGRTGVKITHWREQ